MTYYYGWIAGGVSFVFIILSAISNVSREEEQKLVYSQQVMQYKENVIKECQKVYTDVLDKVPGVANSIASYYYDKEKKDENFLRKYAESKRSKK
jgi:hypothetical protein